MKPSKHTARIGLVYASQKDMAARIAYRAAHCKPGCKDCTSHTVVVVETSLRRTNHCT